MNKSSELLAQHIITHFNGMLNKTALIKLLYLCELESITLFKERFSDIQFKHYNYGPYFPDVNDIIKSLEIENDVLTIKQELFVLDKDIKNEKHLKVLQTVENRWDFVKNYGGFKGKNLTSLLSKVYSSEPFIDTAFDEEIKFENYIGKEINKTLITEPEYKKSKNFLQKKYKQNKIKNFVNEARKQLEDMFPDE